MYSLAYVFHRCRFIQGTSEGSLSGLLDWWHHGWNKDRASAYLSVNAQSGELWHCSTAKRCRHVYTMLQIDSLSEKVLGRQILPQHTIPYKYSVELLVFYVYSQSGEELPEYRWAKWAQVPKDHWYHSIFWCVNTHCVLTIIYFLWCNVTVY